LGIEALESSGGTTTDGSFYDDSAAFRYDTPFQANIGVAYLSKDFELEGDLIYHASKGPFTVFSSTAPLVITTSTGGGAPTTSSQALADHQITFRNVTNLAVGARYVVGPKFNLHAGFYTSFSPVKDPDELLFRKIDLYGGTFGASVTIGSLSGALGAAYETGTSDPFTITRGVTGTPFQTTLKVSSIRLVYALSFQF
jgi:hypothetical protein